MNPSLLAIGIAVQGAPSVSVCPVSSESASTRNVKQSLIASSDSPILSGGSQPTQFDKVLAVAELHSSDDALSGEAAPQVSQENQDEPELVTEDCPFLAVQAADLVQSFDKLRMVSNVEPLAAPVALVSAKARAGVGSPAAPVSAFAERTGGEGETAKIDPDESVFMPQGELRPRNDPASLIGMLSDSKLSLVALPTLGLNVTKPLGQIPLAVKSEDTPLSTPSNQPVTGDVTEQTIGANAEASPILDKTPIGESSLKAGELDATLVSTRPPIQPWHGLPGHSAELSRSPREDTAKLVLSIPVPNAVEGVEGMTVPPEKTPAPPALASQEAAGAVSNGQKIPQLGPLVPPAGGPAQTVSANPEESAFAAKKPIDNKTAAGHKTRILFESVEDGGKKSANNLLNDSASRKLNVVEIQVSAHQAKDPTVSASEVNPNLTQVLSDNNAQILSQRSPTSQTGNTADTAYQGDLSLNIRKQILESIHSSLSGGDRQISIRLNPPELGKVFIRFQEHDAQITGLLEVSQSQTRYQIEQALPQIIRDLQDSGIQIKRLDVVLTEQTDCHASQDQSLLNGWSRQNGSAESGTTGSNKSADSRLTNNDGYQDSLLHQVQITDDSINILA